MTAPSLRAVLDSQLTEKALMQAIVDLARLLGWASYHTWNSRRSTSGWPDLVLAKRPAVAPPQLIFAEIKTQTGRVTASQQWWLDVLRASGQRVFVWRPLDWSSGAIEVVLRA